jgi:hypothetical protein
MNKNDIKGIAVYYLLTLLFGTTVGILSLIIKENSDRIAYYNGKWNKGDIIRGSLAVGLAIVTTNLLKHFVF